MSFLFVFAALYGKIFSVSGFLIKLALLSGENLLLMYPHYMKLFCELQYFMERFFSQRELFFISFGTYELLKGFDFNIRQRR